MYWAYQAQCQLVCHLYIYARAFYKRSYSVKFLVRGFLQIGVGRFAVYGVNHHLAWFDAFHRLGSHVSRRGIFQQPR